MVFEARAMEHQPSPNKRHLIQHKTSPSAPFQPTIDRASNHGKTK